MGYAVRGCRAAIFAAGSGSKTGPEKTIDVDQNGAMAFIDTCARMNALRFVMLSSIAVRRAGARAREPASLLQGQGDRRSGTCRRAASNYTDRAAGLPHQRCPAAAPLQDRRRPRPHRQGDPFGEPGERGTGAGGLPRRSTTQSRKTFEMIDGGDAHRRRTRGALGACPHATPPHPGPLLPREERESGPPQPRSPSALRGEGDRGRWGARDCRVLGS